MVKQTWSQMSSRSSLAAWCQMVLLACVGGILMFGCGPSGSPCKEDADCAKGEICNFGSCVVGCRHSYDCPEGQHCDPSSKTCTEQVCKPGDTQACYDGPGETKGKGACAEGARWCHDTGSGWSPCYEQRLPVAEICDKVDNNCDGKVDDELTCDCEPGATRDCFTGPPTTANVGLCAAGLQYCGLDRKWGECYGQRLPGREICDGEDNDCNGQVDDQIDCECKPGDQRACYSGLRETSGKGICNRGNQVCGPDSRWKACAGQQLPRRQETCNNIDDNCDGLVDNVPGSQDPLREVCYDAAPSTLGKGGCKQGLRSCEAGVWTECKDAVLPAQESCNGKDDDCDGVVDEDLAPRSCIGKGSGCQKRADGTFQCTGTCQVGLQRCEGGAWTDCQGEILPASQEVCGDGKDNDCNGKVDDQCGCKTGETQPCYTGAKDTRGRGECKDGTQTCQSGTWGDCLGEVTPQKESCDGKDTDCDGQADNIAATTCTIPGKIGVCGEGTIQCVANKATCVSGGQLPKEICSGKDDDCDGQVDNIADFGKDCTLPLANGPCAKGKIVCEMNKQICKSLATAKAEECDGVDNDCDGNVDNPTGSCVLTGLSGVCAVGRWSCTNGVKTCTQIAQPATEGCTGKDDNCDGFIDNISDLNQPCADPGRAGLCGPGRWACQANQKACVANVKPAAEICDGVDNDCDGTTDEGLANCKKCTTSLDCVAGSVCAAGFCKVGDCASNDDCAGGKICKQLTCAFCATNSDCPALQRCDTSGTNPVCKRFSCQINSDCGFGRICKAGNCTNCASDADCPTSSKCSSGLCYRACQNANECSPGSVCQIASGATLGQCYPSCQSSAMCPTGFACAGSRCFVSTLLHNGGNRWSDGTYATSCTGYRHPPLGYAPKHDDGVYWIQPSGVSAPFKVLCDMTHESGGWMLLARYSTRETLTRYDPTKHQLQSSQSHPSTPPDLTGISTFGHIKYDMFPIQGRELRFKCSGTDQGGNARSGDDIHWSLFGDWSAGFKGKFRDPRWSFLGYGGVGLSGNDLCSATLASNATYGGLGLCGASGNSYFAVNTVRFDDQASGKTTITCDRASLNDGTMEVWYRAHGTNPLVADATGARQWKDNTVASSCRDYRDSTGGQYTGATGSGTYLIKPIPHPPSTQTPTVIRVECDMDTDLNNKKGGWTLIAKYHSKRSLSYYHPFRHQLQNTTPTQSQTVSAPPDLSDSAVYGHVRYDWFPLRELRMSVKVGAAGTWQHATPFGRMKAWQLGEVPKRATNTTFTTLRSQTSSAPYLLLCWPGTFHQANRRAYGLGLCSIAANSVVTSHYAIQPQSYGFGSKAQGIMVYFNNRYLTKSSVCGAPDGNNFRCTTEANLATAPYSLVFANLYVR